MGSGSKGQAECMAYAIARALIKINPEHESILYNFGLVGHDSRKKEAKKTNLYSARVRPPYVRRWFYKLNNMGNKNEKYIYTDH